MRTSKKYRNDLTTNTPNCKLIENYFNKFSESLNCQTHTFNKREKNPTTGEEVQFYETRFETFESGRIIIKYFTNLNKYSAVFENEDVRLGVFFASSTKGGNTVRFYDGESYYKLEEDYLRGKDNVDNIIDFIDGIMYAGEEEFDNEFFFKTKII